MLGNVSSNASIRALSTSCCLSNRERLFLHPFRELIFIVSIVWSIVVFLRDFASQLSLTLYTSIFIVSRRFDQEVRSRFCLRYKAFLKVTCDQSYSILRDYCQRQKLPRVFLLAQSIDPFQIRSNFCFTSTKLAGNKRRSLSSQGGSLLNRMFGGSSNSSGSKTQSNIKTDEKPPSPGSTLNASAPTPIRSAAIRSASGEKRSGNGSPPCRDYNGGLIDKKRRSSGVSSRASSFLASAKNTLGLSPSSRSSPDMITQSPLQKLGKQDPALAVPQGQHNNSAGESVPGSKSTFRVGVWEDRNKNCRRTMEDTHAFLYNFLATPSSNGEVLTKSKPEHIAAEGIGKGMVESDNGYFAIFDGHAGSFAADWCGKKLHLILEEAIRKNPTVAIPELLDQSFCSVDAQLDKLPLRNSGCTAAVALLRWEDRITIDKPAPAIPSRSLPAKLQEVSSMEKDKMMTGSPPMRTVSSSSLDAVSHTKRKAATVRQRILYTANVGDARIILCRGGKALRLSYDHKGSDEIEGRRIANAGGLILNNRVNGVLAVTRALGDAYLKDLVTGHPYTTETVIQHDLDEFIIIACDGVS